jgi:hypothetical protein
MRTILAGLAGGIAMFVWSSIAHLATPLAETGFSTLPNEQATMQTLATGIGEHGGLFLFPDMRPGKTAQTHPPTHGAFGLLVYRPDVAYTMNPSTLGTEFGVEVVEALIAAFLLSWAAVAGYTARVGFVTLVGLAACITTNVSYWNWYGFPMSYTLAYALIQFVGYFVAGLVIALILPRSASSA